MVEKRSGREGSEGRVDKFNLSASAIVASKVELRVWPAKRAS